LGVSDDSFLCNDKAPLGQQRRPGELLWSFRKDRVIWSAELRFHGESYGWEAQILRDGQLVIGRRFLLKEQAIEWAEEERKAIERGTSAHETL
jgi:hypothetical protein